MGGPGEEMILPAGRRDSKKAGLFLPGFIDSAYPVRRSGSGLPYYYRRAAGGDVDPAPDAGPEHGASVRADDDQRGGVRVVAVPSRVQATRAAA
jgi:hypothetical protein